MAVPHDPAVQAKLSAISRARLCTCRVLQLDCRLKQAPELDDRYRRRGFQQFAVGQGVLAAPAAKELPLLFSRSRLAWRLSWGKPQALAISFTPAL